MIISQFHLLLRVAADDPGSVFEMCLTNLEAVDLRFRFRLVAPVVWADAGMVDRLRAHTTPTAEEMMGSAILAHRDWSQSGDLYVTQWEHVVAAGATRREGLQATKPLLPAGAPKGPIFGPSYVRGYWELTLPPTSPTPRTPPRAQLAHDARVLIACFEVTSHRLDDRMQRDEKVPFPTASGKAEHLIRAEKTDVIMTTTGLGIGATPKRAAKKRRR